MALVNLHTKDKFYYSESSTTVADFIKNIAKEITETAIADYQWVLEYPAGGLEGVTHNAVFSTTTTYGKKFFFSISRETKKEGSPVATTYPITFVEMRIGTELTTEKDKIVTGKVSPVGKLSWYKDDIDPSIQDWLPVNYYLNINKDAINLVVRGDPSADTYNYDKYLTSYAYIGALKEVEEGQSVDDKYNFALTTGSSTEPIYTTMYGPRTATSITDICMIANKIGLPYQPHLPGFYTPNPTMDKLNVEGSRWNNNKHQFSDITVVHPIDMERGKMINVLTGDNSALYDNDRLVFKQSTLEQEMYRKFSITAPYSFINNSANVSYCIAIRCYNEDKEINIEDPTPPTTP